MRVKGRVRPSRLASAVGFVVGVAFVGLGVFVAIPEAGAFGVLWTFAALAVASYHAFNLFSERGGAEQVIEFDTATQLAARRSRSDSPEQRLATLDSLRRKGLISDDEYAQQRQRILDEI